MHSPSHRLLLLATHGRDAMRQRLAQLRTLATDAAEPDALALLASRLQAELPASGDCRCAILAAEAHELPASVAIAERLLRSGGLAIEGGVSLGVGGLFRIGLLFPGQGAPVSSGAGATGELIPRAAAVFDAIEPPPPSGELPPERVQLALVASCLAALVALEELGLRGEVALGHSLGELVALHWAGAFDARALLSLARARGEAMCAHAAAPGAMATLCADERTVAGVTKGLDVTLACLNSPNRSVVSGEVEAIAAVLARARELRIRAVKLNVVGAFHSPLMRPAVPVFEERLRGERLGRLRRRVLSSVSGRALDADADLVRLLARQIVEPVRFLEAARIAAAETDLLLEVGPGRALAGLMAEIAQTPVVSMRVGESSPRGLLEASAAIFAAGAMPLERTLPWQAPARGAAHAVEAALG